MTGVIKPGLALGLTLIAVAGCGSSSSSANNSKSCWTAAAHTLAVHQAHVFLAPAIQLGAVSKSKLREVEALDQSSNMTVITRWSAGKYVDLKPHQGGGVYRGPTLTWLRATKARCGALR